MGFFTDTITVYNHYRDTENEKDGWRRTVVKGVQWTHGKRQINVVSGVVTESIVESLTIDFQRQYKGRKPYLEPLEYARLTGEEAAGYWTLNQQDGMAYIVLGESELDIKKPTELRENYQYYGVVKSVADHRNRPRLKHIQVVVQ